MNLKKKITVGVASAALVASMGGLVAPAVAVDGKGYQIPGFAANLGRLAGADRVQTSLKVAAHEFGSRVASTVPEYYAPHRYSSFDEYVDVNGKKYDYRPMAKRVYIASAEDKHMVDAASAGMLVDGPIVFVSNNAYVGTAVGQFLKDTKTNSGFSAIKEVVPIGGTAAIADSVAKAVAAELPGGKVGTRLAGDDRYGTSVAIADYMYTEAAKGNNWYKRLVDSRTSTLGEMYFANGADNHVVDSMVGGTLDNGPVLLVQPDGKIPEKVAEFIKKTLPYEFAALGGTAAVPDSTVNEAWVIKALGNKWDSSYSIPKTKKDIDKLKFLIKGNGNSRDTDASDFMGVEKVVKHASAILSSWNNRVDVVKSLITDKFNKHNNDWAPAAAIAGIKPELVRLYGDYVTSMSNEKLLGMLKYNTNNNTAYGFDYEAFEGSTDYAKRVSDAKGALEKWWQTPKHQGTLADLTDAIAVASQYQAAGVEGADARKDAAGAYNSDTVDNNKVTVPLAAVTAAAKHTYDTDVKWLEDLNKQLATAQQCFRGELDKINPKTVLRLGGKDRFETAQLIANQFGRLYGGEFQTNYVTANVFGKKDMKLSEDFNQAYVANGHRLPDSLTAGQLTRGPILLARGKEAKLEDLPKFTVDVAKNLQCWTKNQKLGIYGIGGSAVLVDSSIRSIVDLVNQKSVCGAKPATKGVIYDLTGKTVTAPPAGTGSTTVSISGSTSTPTGVQVESVKNTSDTEYYSATAADDKISATVTGTKIEFTIGKDVPEGTYYAEIKDGDKRKGKITIAVGNTITVENKQTAGKDDIILLASDTTAQYDVKWNGQSSGDATCEANTSHLTVANAGGVVTVTGKTGANLTPEGTYTLTCTKNGKKATADIVVQHKKIAPLTISALDVSKLKAGTGLTPANVTFTVKLSRPLATGENLGNVTATVQGGGISTLTFGNATAAGDVYTFAGNGGDTLVAGETYTIAVATGVTDATAVNSPLAVESITVKVADNS